MKKFLYVTIAVILLAGCSAQEPGTQFGELIVPDKKELSQVLGAMDKAGHVTFQSITSWRASISAEGTTDEQSWISLDQTQGSQGNHTVTFVVTPNDTGADRTAVITFTAGKDRFGVSVTQLKYVAPLPIDPASRYVSRVTIKDGRTLETEVYRFGYDNNKRVNRMDFLFDGGSDKVAVDIEYGVQQAEVHSVYSSHYSEVTTGEDFLDEVFIDGLVRLDGQGNIVSGKLNEVYESYGTLFDNGYIWEVTYDQGYISKLQASEYELENGEKVYESAPSDVTFTWDDGNLVEAAGEGWSNRITYTDIANRAGGVDLNCLIAPQDWWTLVGATYLHTIDMFGVRSRNMIERIEEKTAYRTYITTYQYTLDEQGLIVGVQITDDRDVESTVKIRYD